MATKPQSPSPFARLSRIGLGLNLKSLSPAPRHRSSVPSQRANGSSLATPNRNQGDDWYIPYNGPYEPPPQPVQRRDRDSWGDPIEDAPMDDRDTINTSERGKEPVGRDAYFGLSSRESNYDDIDGYSDAEDQSKSNNPSHPSYNQQQHPNRRANGRTRGRAFSVNSSEGRMIGTDTGTKAGSSPPPKHRKRRSTVSSITPSQDPVSRQTASPSYINLDTPTGGGVGEYPIAGSSKHPHHSHHPFAMVGSSHQNGIGHSPQRPTREQQQTLHHAGSRTSLASIFTFGVAPLKAHKFIASKSSNASDRGISSTSLFGRSGAGSSLNDAEDSSLRDVQSSLKTKSSSFFSTQSPPPQQPHHSTSHVHPLHPPPSHSTQPPPGAGIGSRGVVIEDDNDNASTAEANTSTHAQEDYYNSYYHSLIATPVVKSASGGRPMPNLSSKVSNSSILNRKLPYGNTNGTRPHPFAIGTPRQGRFSEEEERSDDPHPSAPAPVRVNGTANVTANGHDGKKNGEVQGEDEEEEEDYGNVIVSSSQSQPPPPPPLAPTQQQPNSGTIGHLDQHPYAYASPREQTMFNITTIPLAPSRGPNSAPLQPGYHFNHQPPPQPQHHPSATALTTTSHAQTISQGHPYQNATLASIGAGLSSSLGIPGLRSSISTPNLRLSFGSGVGGGVGLDRNGSGRSRSGNVSSNSNAERNVIGSGLGLGLGSGRGHVGSAGGTEMVNGSGNVGPGVSANAHGNVNANGGQGDGRRGDATPSPQVGYKLLVSSASEALAAMSTSSVGLNAIDHQQSSSQRQGQPKRQSQGSGNPHHHIQIQDSESPSKRGVGGGRVPQRQNSQPLLSQTYTQSRPSQSQSQSSYSPSSTPRKLRKSSSHAAFSSAISSSAHGHGHGNVQGPTFQLRSTFIFPKPNTLSQKEPNGTRPTTANTVNSSSSSTRGFKHTSSGGGAGSGGGNPTPTTSTSTRPPKSPLIPKGKDRWLSAETWCDALLFPKPRLKLKGVGVPIPAPIPMSAGAMMSGGVGALERSAGMMETTAAKERGLVRWASATNLGGGGGGGYGAGVAAATSSGRIVSPPGSPLGPDVSDVGHGVGTDASQRPKQEVMVSRVLAHSRSLNEIRKAYASGAPAPAMPPQPLPQQPVQSSVNGVQGRARGATLPSSLVPYSSRRPGSADLPPPLPSSTFGSRPNTGNTATATATATLEVEDEDEEGPSMDLEDESIAGYPMSAPADIVNIHGGVLSPLDVAAARLNGDGDHGRITSPMSAPGVGRGGERGEPKTPPRALRPKSWAQDDLAIPSPVPSLAQVLAEGQQLEDERKKWRAQAMGSFQNKRSRSVSRSRAKSLTAKGRQGLVSPGHANVPLPTGPTATGKPRQRTVSDSSHDAIGAASRASSSKGSRFLGGGKSKTHSSSSSNASSSKPKVRGSSHIPSLPFSTAATKGHQGQGSISFLAARSLLGNQEMVTVRNALVLPGDSAKRVGRKTSSKDLGHGVKPLLSIGGGPTRGHTSLSSTTTPPSTAQGGWGPFSWSLHSSPNAHHSHSTPHSRSHSASHSVARSNSTSKTWSKSTHSVGAGGGGGATSTNHHATTGHSRTHSHSRNHSRNESWSKAVGLVKSTVAICGFGGTAVETGEKGKAKLEEEEFECAGPPDHDHDMVVELHNRRQGQARPSQSQVQIQSSGNLSEPKVADNARLNTPSPSYGSRISPVPSNISDSKVGLALTAPPVNGAPGYEGYTYVEPGETPLRLPTHPYASGHLPSQGQPQHQAQAAQVIVTDEGNGTEDNTRRISPSLHPYARASSPLGDSTNGGAPATGLSRHDSYQIRGLVALPRNDSDVPPPAKMWAQLAPGIVNEVLPGEIARYSPYLASPEDDAGGAPFSQQQQQQQPRKEPVPQRRPAAKRMESRDDVKSIVDLVGVGEALFNAASQPPLPMSPPANREGGQGEQPGQPRSQPVQQNPRKSPWNIRRKPPPVASFASASQASQNVASSNQFQNSNLSQEPSMGRKPVQYDASVPPYIHRMSSERERENERYIGEGMRMSEPLSPDDYDLVARKAHEYLSARNVLNVGSGGSTSTFEPRQETPGVLHQGEVVEGAVEEDTGLPKPTPLRQDSGGDSPSLYFGSRPWLSNSMADDLEQFHDLFYRPNTVVSRGSSALEMALAGAPNQDDSASVAGDSAVLPRPTPRSTAPWDMRLSMASRSRRTGSGLTTLARQLSEEMEYLNAEAERDRERDGSEDENHRSKSTPGLEFVLEEGPHVRAESPDMVAEDHDDDSDMRLPEDVESSRGSSPMNRLDEEDDDEDETQLLRVGLVESLLRPPVVSGHHRTSLTGQTFTTRAVRPDSEIQDLPPLPPSASTIEQMSPNREHQVGVDSPPFSPSQYISRRAQLSSLLPPSADATRSSYMTTSTASRMSGLSDFPSPPPRDDVTITVNTTNGLPTPGPSSSVAAHMSLLSSYFDEASMHRVQEGQQSPTWHGDDEPMPDSADAASGLLAPYPTNARSATVSMLSTSGSRSTFGADEAEEAVAQLMAALASHSRSP